MRSFTLAAIMLTLFVLPAYAQRRHSAPDPFRGHFPGMSERLQQRLSAAGPFRPGGMTVARKTTAGNERLRAEATYHYNAAPVQADSIVFTYSGGRSSEFNYDWLGFDYEEAQNDFYPVQFGQNGFVDYDSLRYYDFSGSPDYSVPGIRSYNAAGKVASAIKEEELILFRYDAAGRLASVTYLDYDSSISGYDTSSRNFYYYNASGHLVKDSTEIYNYPSAGWNSAGASYYTLNAAGFPTESESAYILGSMFILFETNYTYNASNQLTGSLYKYYDGMYMVNSYRDTIGYSGAMRVYKDEYRWDTSAKAWSLSGQERRRLNAAGLPDSSWYRWVGNMPGMSDTSIEKLTYNAQNNPVNMLVFWGQGPADMEYRWYYEPVSPAGISRNPAKQDLVVYPNPATDVLRLKGASQGSYAILNTAGQMLQSGTLHAAAIPVGMLPAGTYMISVRDQQGMLHTGSFVRR